MMKRKNYILPAIVLAVSLTAFISTDSEAARRKIKRELTEHDKDSIRRDLNIFISKAETALQKGDTLEAQLAFESAYPMSITVADKEGIIKSGMFLGNLYISTGKTNVGLKILERVHDMAGATGKAEMKFQLAALLAEAYEREANPGAAYIYMKEITAMRDSVDAIQQAEAEALLKHLADTRIKEAETAAALKIKESEAKLKEIQLQLYAVSGAGFLFLILWIIAWSKTSGLKKKLDKSQQENQHIILREKQNAAVIEKLNHELRDYKLIPKVEEKKPSIKENVIQESITRKEAPVTANRLMTAEEKYRNVFLKLVPQRLQQIEESLKKSDWQQVQRLIIQMEPQLLDTGMKTIKPLLEQIEKMDGKTSYLTWHTSVKEFCDQVQHKLEELQTA